jgi:hypothetical protein
MLRSMEVRRRAIVWHLEKYVREERYNIIDFLAEVTTIYILIINKCPKQSLLCLYKGAKKSKKRKIVKIF